MLDIMRNIRDSTKPINSDTTTSQTDNFQLKVVLSSHKEYIIKTYDTLRTEMETPSVGKC